MYVLMEGLLGLCLDLTLASDELKSLHFKSRVGPLETDISKVLLVLFSECVWFHVYKTTNSIAVPLKSGIIESDVVTPYY
jgi:hypothetical protein